MILGKRDKEYVNSLEQEIRDLRSSNNYKASQLLNYLHDEVGISYTKIAAILGVSQQYINNICLGKFKAKNETIYKMMSKLFTEE